MEVQRIVLSRNVLDEESLFITLYDQERLKQVGILTLPGFLDEHTCTVYKTYKNYLQEVTNKNLLYIDFLTEERGLIFTYEGNKQIEYHHTYFSFDDPFFQYLFKNFIYRTAYQEKLKIFTKNKKNDTL